VKDPLQSVYHALIRNLGNLKLTHVSAKITILKMRIRTSARNVINIVSFAELMPRPV
jgi:hypothetical protein